MRLRTADRVDHLSVKLEGWSARAIEFRRALAGQVVGRAGKRRGIGRRQAQVAVRWNLNYSQSDLLGSARFGQVKSKTLMDWDAAAQVRKRERLLPIAAVGRADQLKERFVF